MSNAAMKLNETSSDAYEKLEALLSPDVIKLGDAANLLI